MLAGQSPASGESVVHVAAGRLDRTALDGVAAAAPDVVLLVGGTDGGEAGVLRLEWRGEGGDEYRDPTEFFRRTFLTEGLKHLLSGALRRLGGDGGDPVVELQTNFGGGKTHSLIALYHLAAGYEPAKLPGVEQMLAVVVQHKAAVG